MKAMICPQCGGKIDKVFESKALAECGYCGAKVMLREAENPAPEAKPEVRDTSRVPLEDYKPFDEYGPEYESPRPGEGYDTTFEEYAGTLNKTGFKVIGIAAAVCFGLFVVIIFGVVATRKKPEPVYPGARPVYSAQSTPALTRPTAPSVANADAVTLPAPVLPRGTRVARKTQIQVYVTVDDNGDVYEAQAYDGSEPFKKAAVEAANKAKFKSRTDKQWSSGVLVYDFGTK